MKKTSALIIILDRWPSRAAIALDAGVDLFAVHRWYQRGGFPARHDATLIAAARRRKIRLSAREIVDARSARADQHGHSKRDIQDAVPTRNQDSAA